MIEMNSPGECREFPWRDDFAAARNLSLSEAHSDWILVLDADEALSPETLPRLRDQRPTWARASALARDWQLTQLAERLAKLAACDE